jgi:hypothetical protein
LNWSERGNNVGKNEHAQRPKYIFELPSKFLMLKVERVVVIAQLFYR